MLGESSSRQKPSRVEIELKLADLAAGRITREAAAAWARPWGGVYESGIDDPAIRGVLEKIYAADTPSIDRPYLFGPADFEEWLAKLRAEAPDELTN